MSKTNTELNAMINEMKRDIANLTERDIKNPKAVALASHWINIASTQADCNYKQVMVCNGIEQLTIGLGMD